MTTHDRETFAEAVIERELARAGEIEPLAGFEDRLLARLAGHTADTVTAPGSPERRRWWGWRAAAVAAAAAALVVAGLVFRPVTSPAPVRIAANVGTPMVPARPPAVPVATFPPRPAPDNLARPPRAASGSRRAGVGPDRRPEAFPSQAPLSDQERLLVMLAARPEQAADIVDAQARTRDLAPLEFVEIVIEPMKTEGMTASEETENIRPTLKD